MTLEINPEKHPTQVFLGLTSGRIFLFPNFIPNPKAAVSHIHTDRKSADVIENPMDGIFRNVERDPSITPSQINAKTNAVIFRSGVCFFRNISVVMAVSVKPINILYTGIFQVIEGCRSICSIVIKIEEEGEMVDRLSL